MVKLAISLLFVGLTLTGMAQEKVYQVDELSVINGYSFASMTKTTLR